MKVLVRRQITTSTLCACCLAIAILALGMGDYLLSPREVLTALFGDDSTFARIVVVEWRAPRVLAALIFGAALGTSGALFQSLTNNPLGSPDIIGLSTGSYTGALLAIGWWGSGFYTVATGSIIGGVATAAVVYLLAYRDGLQAFRLVIIGIGITAMAHALNLQLLLRMRQEVAMSAALWGSGSLALVGWQELLSALLLLCLLVPSVWALVPSLRQLELGDDTARAHGVRAERAKLLILLVGVALTAIASAAAGPISFIALSAPHIARRLCRSASLPLLASSLVGALLLLVADLVAQFALPTAAPTGAITVVVGGIYLIYVMIREGRR